MALPDSQAAKAKLLAYLKKQGIEAETFEHPVVMTVEEAEKHTGHLEGGHSKNLCLKDKKNRLYLVSALTATKVDMKVLSQRLGLGKNGIRFAPDDVMQAALQVPLGSVTPFALLNESAKGVSLLLDQGFTSKPRLFFHPLSNDATTAISPPNFDKFLASLGRTPVYVDLEANPAISAEQPPDLAPYVPKESAESAATSGEPASTTATPSPAAPSPSPASSGKDGKKAVGKTLVDGTPPKAAIPAADNIDSAVQRVLALCLDTEHSEKDRREKLVPNLEHMLTMFKNAAYTSGMQAGLQSRPFVR